MKKTGHKTLSVMCAAGLAAALAAGVPAAASDSTAASVAESAAESMAESLAEAVLSGAEAVEMERPSYRALDYVTLGQYKGLTVEVEPVSITDEDVDARIEMEISNSEAGSDLLTEGTVQEGDTANIDFEGKKDGVAFDGGTSEGYDLEIGSGSFIEGFEEGLVGVAVGDTVDLNLTFPEYYGNEELAGQDVVFTVKVNSLKRPKELDDALAAELSEGEAADVASYREWIRGRLAEEAMEMRDEQAKAELIQMASGNLTVNSYPQDLMDYTINEITEYYKSYAEMYGMDFPEFLSAAVGVTEEEFPETAKGMAESELKNEFSINAIAEAENLVPEGEELARLYDEFAQRFGMGSGADLVAQYGEETVRYAVAYEKVADFLLENAVVKEVEYAAESFPESFPDSFAEEVLESAVEETN